MKLTWFGHSAFRVEYGGQVVMVDPFLANPTHTGEHAKAYRGTNYVMLTHGHADHVGSTVEICKATGATAVANPEICDFLTSLGIEKTDAINFGGELHFDGFSVALVPAWHSSSHDAEDGDGRYLGNPGGIVLTSPNEKTIYFMGDTGIFGDMQLIADVYAPKIGVVPIGDRFTMGARIAALACKRFFDFETVIPCHYATFDLLDASADKFVTEMQGSKTKVIVPDREKAIEL